MTLSKNLLSRVSAPSSVKQRGILASCHGVRVKRVKTQHHAKQEVLTHVTCFHYELTFKGRRRSSTRLASVVQPPKWYPRSPTSWSSHPHQPFPRVQQTCGTDVRLHKCRCMASEARS